MYIYYEDVNPNKGGLFESSGGGKVNIDRETLHVF